MEISSPPKEASCRSPFGVTFAPWVEATLAFLFHSRTSFPGDLRKEKQEKKRGEKDNHEKMKRRKINFGGSLTKGRWSERKK
jgi:hypothetical protein